jgi:hypothetical protein
MEREIEAFIKMGLGSLFHYLLVNKLLATNGYTMLSLTLMAQLKD